MGNVIPFPIDTNRQLSVQSETLVSDAAALQRDSNRAVRLAEELLGDIITIDFAPSESDFDSPA
jgi:hypothetical protein